MKSDATEISQAKGNTRPLWLNILLAASSILGLSYFLGFGWIALTFEDISQQLASHTLPQRLHYWQDFIESIVTEGRSFALFLSLCHLATLWGAVCMFFRQKFGLHLYILGTLAYGVVFLAYKGIIGTSLGEIMFGLLFVSIYTLYRKHWAIQSENKPDGLQIKP